MSTRHEHRRAARRAHRHRLTSDHGRALFTIDLHGNPLRSLNAENHADALALFPEAPGFVRIAGLCAAEDVAVFAREALANVAAKYPVISPATADAPAAIVAAACDHIREQTAEMFDLLDEDLAAAFLRFPTHWLCWLTVPAHAGGGRPT